MRIAEKLDVDLEQVEKTIYWAFRAIRESSRSSCSMFDGSQSKEGRQKLKSSSKKWTRRHTATETRQAQFSKPAIDDDYGRAGEVMRAINDLDERNLCWVKHQYMNSNSRSDFTRRYMTLVWGEFADKHLSKAEPNKRIIVRKMLNYQMVTSRDFHHKLISPWDYFGVSQKNWYQHFHKYWKAIKQGLNNQRIEALGLLASKI